MGLSCPDPERENHPALWGLPADRRQGRKGGGPGGLGSGQGLAGLRSAGGGAGDSRGPGARTLLEKQVWGWISCQPRAACRTVAAGSGSLHMRPLGSGLPARGAPGPPPGQWLCALAAGLLTGAEVALDPALWGGGLCPGQGSHLSWWLPSRNIKPRYALLVGESG